MAELLLYYIGVHVMRQVQVVQNSVPGTEFFEVGKKVATYWFGLVISCLCGPYSELLYLLLLQS